MENNIPETNNFLNWVEIKNFKSIKDLRLDCKRVNVFIGKPNVGKSNILEGLGVLGAGYDTGKYLNGTVRYDSLNDLFADNNHEREIKVISNRINTVIRILPPFRITPETWFELEWENYDGTKQDYMLSQNGNLHASGTSGFGSRNDFDKSVDDNVFHISPVRKYDFSSLSAFDNTFSDFLLPPHGWNMYSVLNRNIDLWREFAKLFEEQDLEFILLDRERSFALQKKEGGRVKQYPYFSIADTFRRFMFYITAIESNKNSVIIFEEPEVHSFPPYTQEMAYRMIYDESNQYFISTHSPYMLHPFIEKMDYKDLNVFITYYKDYQTHVRALTEEELTDILDYSTNVFFNLRKFEPNA